VRVAPAGDDRPLLNPAEPRRRLSGPGDANRVADGPSAVYRAPSDGGDAGGVAGDVDRDPLAAEDRLRVSGDLENGIPLVDPLTGLRRRRRVGAEVVEHSFGGRQPRRDARLGGNEPTDRLSRHLVRHVVVADVLSKPPLDLTRV